MRKKKNNAFTLIELLAIIVILAIIAVITVPIILNIIENAKKGAAASSANGYKDGVEKYYISRLFENSNTQDTILNGMYSVSEGKLNNIDIPTEGTKPTSGFLNYEKNVLKSACLLIDNYVIEYNGEKFNATDRTKCPTIILVNDSDNNNEISFGDEYLIGTEGFYVIDSDTNNVTLLAKYNLNVGSNKKTTVPEGLQNSTLGSDYGYILFAPQGTVTLTTPGTIEDIYDKLDKTSNDNISYYVEQYVNNLKTIDSSLSITGRLLTMSEAEDLFGCSHSTATCPTDSFLMNTSFWLGTSPANDIIFYISNGQYPGLYGTPSYITAVNLGVRPVITIPRSNF